jgi:transposase
MKDHTEAINACNRPPLDQPGYEALTGICFTCNEPIVQWRAHPRAMYQHTATGYFACNKEYWKKAFAYPKEVANGNQ